MEATYSQALSNEDFMEELKPEEPHAKWSKEQDAFLESIIETYGTRDWNIVADNMNSKFGSVPRTAKQCRLRWQKRQSLSKHNWSEQEEAELLWAHQKYKNSWSDISTALGGRKSNSIKNRFYTIFRKVKNKIKRGDLTYDSKIELLQIQYVLSVIETYLSTITTPEAAAAKAGKDFICKLVQRIDPTAFASYKAKFAELTAAQPPMQDLFQELLKSSEPATIPIPEEIIPPMSAAAGVATIVRSVPEEVKGAAPCAGISPSVPQAVNPTDDHAMMIISPGRDMFAYNYALKECSPLENMVVGISPPPIPKYSPSILSAGPAAAAAAAFKAPCFQASPEDIGFSEFTECAKEFEDSTSPTTHWGEAKGPPSFPLPYPSVIASGLYNAQHQPGQMQGFVQPGTMYHSGKTQ